jgi:WD40 repeat protein
VRVCEIADFERAKTESETTGVQRFVLLKSAVPSGHIAKAWSTVASPDGKWFATGGHDALIHLWDAKTMKLARTLRGHTQMVWHLAFSADSQRLASASTEVKVWDVADGTLRYTAAEPTPSLRPPLVRAVAFHPIQPWLFSAATDSVHRWDARDGKDLGVLHKFPQAIYQLAIEKSGRWLAAACEDHHVAIWDLRDSALAARPPDRLSTGHKHAVWAVAFSEDGRYLASGSSGGVVELWDTADFSRLATIPWPGQQVRGLAFSPGNRHLAIACFEGAGAIIHLADMRSALAKMHLDW